MSYLFVKISLFQIPKVDREESKEKKYTKCAVEERKNFMEFNFRTMGGLIERKSQLFYGIKGTVPSQKDTTPHS